MNGFVLAGGQSTRMGRDKALLAMNGRPLVEHALEVLRGLDLGPRICGARPDLAGFAEVVADNFPQCGPLAGIEAALAVSDSELNLFVPVDLPGLPREFLQWMMVRAERSQVVATIPRYGGRYQPLCAIYSRRLLEGLRHALAAGDCKVIVAVEAAAASLGEAVDAFDVESAASALAPDEWPAKPPLTDWFRNVNTPADYELLRSRVGTKSRYAEH
ncbi:MAG: molybdenum cofactor guanylyltransferase [Acidobacteriaceae bacterium]